jgi:RNA polymerase sigma-70 factor (ECF subfamily)
MGYKGVDIVGESPAAMGASVSNDIVKLQIEPRADTGLASVIEVDSLGQGTATLEREVSELFKGLRDSVYRYLVAVVQDPSVAEEITQEVFLRLYCSLRKHKAIQNVRPWVFRVARNLALNEKARKRFVSSSEESGTLVGLRMRLETKFPDPEQTVLQQERMDLAIQQLSRPQRECLILRVEGFRYREIAEILGLSVPNVAQTLRRGIKKLMRELP